MKKTGKFGIWLLLLGTATYGTAVPPAHSMDKAAQKKILQQARRAYYSLHEHGFAGAEADVRQQWEFTLKSSIQSNPTAGQVILERLKRLHFPVSIDAAGNATVKHQWDPPKPTDAESNEHYNQIYAGADQGISAFFQTWSLFMLDNPFPEVDAVYELEEVEGHYRLSYNDGSASIVTLMGKDFGISEMNVSTAELVTSISPQLQKTPNGYVLTGFVQDFRFAKSRDKAQARVHLEDQEVDGMPLPYRVHINSTYNGEPSETEFLLTDCRLKPR